MEFRQLFQGIVIGGAGWFFFGALVLAAGVEPVLPGYAAARLILPDSDGRGLVARACTNCHDLGGLEAYKGYWSRAQWKAMVEDMVKNGAVLNRAEQEVVADYLTRHFGPGTRQ